MCIGWFIVSPYTVYIEFGEALSLRSAFVMFLYSWAGGRYRMVISGRGFLILVLRRTCFRSGQPRSPASSAFHWIWEAFSYTQDFQRFRRGLAEWQLLTKTSRGGVSFSASHSTTAIGTRVICDVMDFLHLLRARYSVSVSHTWQHLLRSVPVHAGSRGQGFPFPRSLALGVQSALVRYSQDCTGRSTQSLSNRLERWACIRTSNACGVYCLLPSRSCRWSTFWSQVLSSGYAGREVVLFVEFAVGCMSSLTTSSRSLLFT